MDYREKINIYVPEYISEALEKDASMFEVLKKDGRTRNMNRFLSLLISGYYYEYVEECQILKEKVAIELLNQGIERSKVDKVSGSIVKNVFLQTAPARKGKNSTKLSLKPTRDTQALIQSIKDGLTAEDSVSQYFCRMFMSYCKKPFYERERVIFRKKYEELKDVCNKNKTITFSTIWDPQKIHRVIPYRIAVGDDELFNYVLCSEISGETGGQEARSYRLNRISKIIISRDNTQISEDIMGYLNKMLQFGPQYMINDDEETCVKLSTFGEKKFSRIYFGRPREGRFEDQPDGYYYFFKGSKEQAFLYFRRFGSDAEIIAPDTLREKMADFHKKAYENYKRG